MPDLTAYPVVAVLWGPVVSSRLGIRAGHSNSEWVTWGQVLEWSVAAYWTRRPKQVKRETAA